MPIDMTNIDPATATDCPELVRVIAEEWMGWEPQISAASSWDCGGTLLGWHDDCGGYHAAIKGTNYHWSPFTDPADAGEARRKADGCRLEHFKDGCFCDLEHQGIDGHSFIYYRETGDKGKAEALATTRAILGALQAKIWVRSECPDHEKPDPENVDEQAQCDIIEAAQYLNDSGIRDMIDYLKSLQNNKEKFNAD